MQSGALRATTFRVHGGNKMPDARLLREALIANAMFSVATGAVMIIAGGSVASFLGIEASWMVRLVGAGLLPFAVAVAVSARPQNLAARSAFAISAADFVWVLASMVLVLFRPDLLSPAGTISVAVVAVIVTGFASVQVIGVRRLCETDRAG
jgi:hypothetical protein